MRFRVIRIITTGAILAAALIAAPPEPGARRLSNSWEIYREIRPAPGAEAAVKNQFFSFREYQDLVLYHPRFGYYTSGRVSFVKDFKTFPNVLAPYFGRMIAEQAFRMWDGMRRARTLASEERFTLAEFGAGNGALAESILDYIGHHPDPQWREFWRQTVYICYDRSRSLSEDQRRRNARFGAHFEAREADATNPTASIAPESLKGIILSNELPDDFSVHKVILSPKGPNEVAFVVPLLSKQSWSRLRVGVPDPVQKLVDSSDRDVKRQVLQARQRDAAAVYLNREALVALLESLASLPDYASKVRLLRFREMYLPAQITPELAEHLRRYAHSYASRLARDDKGVVAYINLGEGQYMEGAGRILKAGYVITIDYGSTWDELISSAPFRHLRTFGPGNRSEDSAPYRRPTLNDITSDVNFSHMAAEGRSAGLNVLYLGPQAALSSGTPIALGVPPPGRKLTGSEAAEFDEWSDEFLSGDSFKLLVQQKRGTDDAYSYPDRNSLPVDVAEGDLTAVQRKKAARIEQILRGSE